MMEFDMKKIEENKEEIKAKIAETEKDLAELAASENELDRKLAKLISTDLSLIKTIVGDSDDKTNKETK